jgi:glycosyltransferase involved in cell wall biosynthesis
MALMIPMRVCILAHKFYESAPRVMNFANALARRGHCVEVIALRHKGQPTLERVESVSVFRIHERILYAEGPLHYVCEFLRFFVKSAALMTKRHFVAHYDLVHVFGTPDVLVFAAAVPKLTGSVLLYDCYDLTPEFFTAKYAFQADSFAVKTLRLLERMALWFCDHVVAANELWRRRLVSRSIDPTRCSTISYYPDPQIFFPRPRRRNNGKIIMAYAGSLNHFQGVDIALRSFSKIADEYPNAEFHVYGDGPELHVLQRLAANLSLSGKITFYNLKPAVEIATLVAQADVVVVPKRDDTTFSNEAQSTKILEAMMLGVPVIAPRTAIESYLYRETDVKYFQPKDEVNLAGAMRLLLDSPALRANFANAGLVYAAENNWNAKQHLFHDLVNRLTAGHLRVPKSDPVVAKGKQTLPCDDSG